MTARLETEVLVVGAGVVGLAVAAALARDGRQVVVLERNAGVAQETTSRSSEVVHAGLYYPTGSLKARSCVEGREALYARCRQLGVPHRKLGKWIVATSAGELPALERLLEQGIANGVAGLRLVDGREVRARDPDVRAVAALDSPESGIVDAHAYARSFQVEAEAHGASLVLRSELLEVEPGAAQGYRLRVRDADGAAVELGVRAVVNAAGLWSDRVVALAGLDPEAHGLRIHWCKGDYFQVAPGAPVKVGRLVYPLPSGPGLGIHLTLDLGGRLRIGPDAEYVSEISYRVDERKAEAFARAAGRYLRRVEPGWLSPDQAGVRAKLAGPGEGFRDFVVAERSSEGLPGWVDLVGIESPGLTAAIALAERVRRLLASI